MPKYFDELGDTLSSYSCQGGYANLNCGPVLSERQALKMQINFVVMRYVSSGTEKLYLRSPVFSSEYDQTA
jgi:hypothetical protein